MNVARLKSLSTKAALTVLVVMGSAVVLVGMYVVAVVVAAIRFLLPGDTNGPV